LRGPLARGPERPNESRATGENVSRKKLERQFREAVQSSGLVDHEQVDYALGFQRHAWQKRGTRYPLDRVLLKFRFLDEPQIETLYGAIRYYSWRREDKFFLKIAIQSNLLSQRRATRCLIEQKRLYKDSELLRRVNEIARRRCYMTERQELAVIDAMKKCRGVTIVPTEISLERAESEIDQAPSDSAKPRDDESEAPLGTEAARPGATEPEAKARAKGKARARKPKEAPKTKAAPRGRPKTTRLPDDPFEDDSDIDGDSDFDAFRTDDDIDALLAPLHEDDALDNFASAPRTKPKGKGKGKAKKRASAPPKAKAKAKGQPPKAKAKGKNKAKAKPGRRADPFEDDGDFDIEAELSDQDSKALNVLSDDDLDALWDEADLDDLDLDSDARDVKPQSLLDSEADLDYSSDDDLF
jgi:hypothetical protein